MSKRKLLIAGSVVLVGLLLAALAAARPGGGQTYSGSSSGSSSTSSGSGSSGSSGGGGDGAGVIIELLLMLVVEYPQVGIPLLLVVGVGYFVMSSSEQLGRAWDSSSFSGASEVKRLMEAAGAELEQARQSASVVDQLEGIRQLDPKFSLALFEDFLFALYVEVHRARGAGTLERLAPFVREQPLRQLAATSVGPVEAVVIGALRYLEVRGVESEAARVGVSIEIEANYTEIEAGTHRTYYVLEVWELSRDKQASSRPPKRARTIDCPSCGAPLDKIVNATCGYCHSVVGNGELDWIVESVQQVRREPRPPALTGDVEERGTERDTVVHPRAKERFAALTRRDPGVTFEALERRVRLVFEQLFLAWNARDLLKARAFLSDRAFETLGYWLDAYRAAGLRNVTEAASVSDVRLARVLLDAYYDSVTVRVFAESLDYTLDAAGKVVSGSRSEPRAYTEYWTLIRGASVQGTPRLDLACPSCGAPLDIGMTGTCNHCNVEVTAGQFDWVLSKIEQDDSY